MMNLNWIPKSDKARSPFSKWVFDQAEKRSLYFSHFETRYSLPIPESWGGTAEEITKDFDGISVSEDKFSHFRTDCLIASFHPGHHAKWGSHELLHNLLGFYFNENSSDLEKLLGARISESLPVALFYFFDEAWSKKCTDHYASSAFLNEHCKECESLQNESALKEDSYLMQSGLEFCRREFHSIRTSIEKNYSSELVFHGINLASDAHLYLQNNRHRLNDQLLGELVEDFYQNQPVYHNISGFLNHAERLLNCMLENKPLPISSTKAEDYLKQDLAQRLLQMTRLCGEGEIGEHLLLGLEILKQKSGSFMIDEFVAFYEEIYKDYEIISPQKFFSLGYDFHPRYGHDLEALLENLKLCFPESLTSIETQDLRGLVFQFSRSTEFWSRSGLAQRFCDFLETLDHSFYQIFKSESFFQQNKSSFSEIQFSENQSIGPMDFHPSLEVLSLTESEVEKLKLETSGLQGDMVFLKIPGRRNASFYPLQKLEYLEIKKHLKTGQSQDVDPNVIDELIRSNFIVGRKNAGNQSSI